MKIVLRLLFLAVALPLAAQNVTVQVDPSTKKLTGTSKTIVVPSGGSISADIGGSIAATSIPGIAVMSSAPLTGGGTLTGNITIGLPVGNLTESTSNVLTLTGGTGAVVGSGLTIQVKQANGSTNGFLSSTDWTTFNSKESVLTFSAPMSRSGNTVSLPAATGSVNGYLTSGDWTTFNAKQSAGSYLTALTGDVSASGPGSAAATLATVNLNVGTFGNATQVGTFTVDGKGRINAASNVTVTPAFGSITGKPTTLAGYGITDAVPSSRTVSTTGPLAGGGALSGDLTLSIANAAADGATKGAAAFTASDFDATAGVVSLDYANGQKASVTLPGFLSATDWSTFNGKENVLTFSAPLSRTTNAISIPAANGSTNGYLTSTDWSTFNGKQSALTFGNLTESTSSVLTITGGTGSVIGSGASIQVKQAGAGQSGFLSSTDWSTFNGKQPAGNYITALTGDVTASGPGSVSATVSRINGVSLAGLSTGLLVNTTGTGAPSIATIGSSLSFLGGTLNTAQDIRTSATPYFASIGVGASPLSPVYVLKDGRNSGGTWREIARFADAADAQGITLGYNPSSGNSVILAHSNGPKRKFEFWAYDGTTWSTATLLDYVNGFQQLPDVSTGSTLDAFGDSITVGFDASSQSTTAYVPLLARAKGWTATNHAVSGDMVADQANSVFGTTINNGSASTIMIGTNDARKYLSNAGGQLVYKNAHAAVVAALAIPTYARTTGQAMTTTGTWSNMTVYSNGIQSTTNGSTAQASVWGDTVLMNAVVLDGYNGGTFTVTIDSTTYGPYSNAPDGTIATFNGTTWAPKLYVFSNLGRTSHTVTITVTSATGANNFVGVHFLAGIPFISTSAKPPVVYAGTIPRYGAAGIVTHGVTDAIADQFNAIVRSNVALLSGLGLQVTLVDVTSHINNTTDLDTDGVHPVDSGHQHICEAFLQGSSGIVQPNDRRYAQIASITGTANQVSVAQVGSAVTLSLPSTVNVASQVAIGASGGWAAPLWIQSNGTTVTQWNEFAHIVNASQNAGISLGYFPTGNVAVIAAHSSGASNPLELWTYNGSAYAAGIRINGDRTLKFGAYGAGILASDASGNITSTMSPSLTNINAANVTLTTTLSVGASAGWASAIWAQKDGPNIGGWNEIAHLIKSDATAGVSIGYVGTGNIAVIAAHSSGSANPLELWTYNGSTFGPGLRVNGDKTLKFPGYGAGILKTDASGNVSASSALTALTNVGIGSQPVSVESVALWSNVTGPGGSTGVQRAAQFYSTYTGVNAHTALDLVADATGSASYDHAVALQAYAKNNTSGNVNHLMVLNIVGAHNGSGTVTTADGIYWGGWSGTGTYTNKFFINSGASVDPAWFGGNLITTAKLTVGAGTGGNGTSGSYLGLFNGINPIVEYQNQGTTLVYTGSGSQMFSGANNNDFGIMQNDALRSVIIGVNGEKTLTISKTNVLMPATATLTLATGSAAAPSLNFTGGTTAGFYNYNSTSVGYAASGSLSLILSAGGAIYAANASTNVQLLSSTVTINPAGVNAATFSSTTATLGGNLVVNGGGTHTFAGPIKPASYTVATLPSASTSGSGAVAYATDLSSITSGSTAIGGGSSKHLVASDGTNWLVQ